MKAYELVLKDFDGSTDTTDHLIKWVWIDDKLTLKLAQLCNRIEVKSVHEMVDMHKDDSGFDAIITTHKQLLKFLSKC